MRLSPRSLEILFLIGKGKNNQDIADELGLALQTVKNHVTHILRALKAKNRRQAVIFARRQGIDIKTMMTVPEVAYMLSISRNTVRRWHDKGILRGYRLPGRGDRRFRIADIETFLKRSKDDKRYGNPSSSVRKRT